MTLTVFDNLLWAAGLAGHVILLMTLLWRNCWLRFPIFTTLVAYQVVVTISLFLVSRLASQHVYFLTYWISACGDYGFQVALIIEIASIVLRPARKWLKEALVSFIAWSIAGGVIAVVLSLSITPPQVIGPDLWDMRASLFTSLLTCGLYLALSTSANQLGLQRRDHVIAIGRGLALWASVAVIGDVAHVLTGWHRNFIVFDYFRMIMYISVLVYWVAAFSFHERRPPATDLEVARLATFATVVETDV